MEKENKIKNKKRLGVFIGILFLMILLSNLINAEVYVNEGFEDGAFDPPYKYICDVPEPSDCTNTAEHVTNVKKAGTRSLECVYNQAGAAGVKIKPGDYGYSNFGNNAYLRFYIKYDLSFRFYSMTKMIIWHGNHVYFNINGCDSDGNNEGSVDGSRYGRPTILCEGDAHSWYYVDTDFVVDVENQQGDGWWMFEWNLNGDTGKTSLWIMRPQDSVPTKVIDDVSCDDGDGANEELDINWINAVSGGSGGKLWVDEIVVADEYIGPINGGSSCGDGTCDPGETCLADSCCNGVTYNPSTQVCCSGTTHTGNCCSDTDCTSPNTCASNICTSPSPECSDGIDNDGDGQTDYPNDAGCSSNEDNDETNCGDTICEGGETCSSCPADCGCTGGNICCSGTCQIPTCSQNSDCGIDTACRIWTCNNPGTCSASCSFLDITSCINNDGCCPSGCVFSNDNNCPEGEITEIWGETSDSDYSGTVEDTFLNQDEWGNDVNANSIQLNTYTWPTDVIANTILMKFDLSAIPSSATITSAQLQLYQYEWDTDRDDSYRLTAHKVINHNPIISQANGYTYDGTNSWTAVTPSGSYYENDFGYLCCNGNVPMAMNDISNIVDTVYADRIEGYKTWDITSMVSDWVNNPFSNYGLLIVSEDNTFGEAHRLFYSSEYSDSTRRPKLIVSYSLGTTTCSPADTNSDGVVSMVELMSYIGLWKAGNVNIVELMTGIDEWKNGC